MLLGSAWQLHSVLFTASRLVNFLELLGGSASASVPLFTDQALTPFYQRT